MIFINSTRLVIFLDTAKSNADPGTGFRRQYNYYDNYNNRRNDRRYDRRNNRRHHRRNYRRNEQCCCDSGRQRRHWTAQRGGRKQQRSRHRSKYCR